MRIVGLSIALTLALTACDGGDKDTDPTDETPTDEVETDDTDDTVGDDTDNVEDDTDDVVEDDTENPTDTEDDDSVDDPTEDLAGSADCDDFDGTEIPGATRYYAGDFDIASDDTVTGVEYALYFANDTWVAAGGGDCNIAWNVMGTKESCSGCDYSLDLAMSIDKSATTCDEDLWAGDESFTATYEVTVSGTTTTYAFTSGTQLGTGETNTSGTESTYVSDSQCAWF